jgi:hypothetical protein
MKFATCGRLTPMKNAKYHARSAGIKSPNVCRAIVMVDDSSLRLNSSSEFRKLFANYSRHLGEIAHHEAKVRPAYWRWLAASFGDRIDNVKKLHAALLQKVAILNRIRELCIFEGLSRISAFEQATDEFPSNDEAEEENDSQNTESRYGDEDGFGADFKDDTSGSQSESSWSHRDSPRKQAAATEAMSREAKVKFYYRKLAQTLHPDLARGETDLSREYWQETQDAYQNHDLDRLQLIWTMVSLHTDSLSRELRLFDLRSAVAQMKEKVRVIKNEKRRLNRTDPSWGFDKKDHGTLAGEIRSDIENDERTIDRALRDVEDDLRAFSKKPKKHSKPAELRHIRNSRSRSTHFEEEQMGFDF